VVAGAGGGKDKKKQNEKHLSPEKHRTGIRKTRTRLRIKELVRDEKKKGRVKNIHVGPVS